MDKPIRILILEDNDDDTALLTLELSKIGFEVEIRKAKSKDEFLAEIENYAPDLILADYHLPQFNALDALGIVNDLNCDAALILVTGSQSEETAVECINFGAADYLLKFNLTRLSSAIRNALEKRESERARQQAMKELKASEERYRNFLENAADIIQGSTLDGKIVYVNRAWRETLGYDEQEIEKLNILDIIHPDDRERFSKIRQRVFQGEASGHFEIRFVSKNGRVLTVEGSSNGVFENGRVVATRGIYRDITERKLLEEQLRQAQKMEAVGQLAGSVAHDFNNLLTAILGYTDLSLNKVHQSEPLRENLEEIKKAGLRAVALTKQLLTFSRKRNLQTRVFDLNQTIEDLYQMLSRLIGENIELKRVLCSRIAGVKADPDQVTQILMNLAINARDAMPQGGQLTIETKNVYLKDDFSQRHPTVSGHFVLLSVTDTGIGIDEKIKDRIFEPFFTTKEPGKGTGLGLSTVYGIVRQSGGVIEVESEIGKGTTFKIFLPQADPPSENIAHDVDLNRSKQSKQTILVVDDEDIVRNLTRQILEIQGYNILSAGNGEEAIALFAENSEKINLLMTDISMPKMSGIELAETLKLKRPDLQVLFTTGYAETSNLRANFENAELLPKPYTFDDLTKRIHSLLAAKD